MLINPKVGHARRTISSLFAPNSSTEHVQRGHCVHGQSFHGQCHISKAAACTVGRRRGADWTGREVQSALTSRHKDKTSTSESHRCHLSPAKWRRLPFQWFLRKTRRRLFHCVTDILTVTNGIKSSCRLHRREWGWTLNCGWTCCTWCVLNLDRVFVLFLCSEEHNLVSTKPI